MEKTYDCIIVGAGPSGLTAALNLRRNGKTCIVLEKETIGGQIAVSPRVENIPGTKEISGETFANNLFDQISDLGADFGLENVESITKENDMFIVKTDYETYKAYSVILATGCKHREINVKGEKELTGKGISYCAVCDGAFYKNEDVVLIGDANTALQYALLLSNYCTHVYLNTLFDKFFADKILIERIFKTPNIIVAHNLNLIEIKGQEKLEGLVFEDTKTKETKEFKVRGAFVAIGQLPDNDKFKDIVKLNKGYVVTNENMETSCPGIYAIGDCRDKKVRQLTTAFSDASIASFNVNFYIEDIKGAQHE
jgi:thioredoxin reductase (NADPH)